MSMVWEMGELVAVGADLGRAGAKTTREAESVVQESTQKLEKRAETYAPARTGALRGSIESRVSGLTGTVSANIRYAEFQEWGTSKMAPQPYAGPALEAVAPEFVAEMEKLGAEFLD